MAQEAPYKLSRSALRDRYGSRAIDARTKYSAQDDTPSARQGRVLAAGGTQRQAEAADLAAFDEKFRNQAPATPLPQIKVSNFQPPQMPNANNMFAPPMDVGSMVNPFGPITLGLLPETQNGPEAFAPFLPQTNSPLSSFSTPNRMFRQPNKWSTSLFG